MAAQSKSRTVELRELRLAHLGKANEVRTAKAQEKRRLAALDPVEAFALLADRLVNDPDAIGSFSVEEMLLSINGVGRRKATLMARAAQSTSMIDKIGRLPEFRRAALAQVLLDRAAEVHRVQAA